MNHDQLEKLKHEIEQTHALNEEKFIDYCIIIILTIVHKVSYSISGQPLNSSKFNNDTKFDYNGNLIINLRKKHNNDQKPVRQLFNEIKEQNIIYKYKNFLIRKKVSDKTDDNTSAYGELNAYLRQQFKYKTIYDNRIGRTITVLRRFNNLFYPIDINREGPNISIIFYEFESSKDIEKTCEKYINKLNDIRQELLKIKNADNAINEAENIAKKQRDDNHSEINSEFQALIEEKTRYFCGREFVFKKFQAFIQDHPCGYFTVLGEAGIGKSAIAAKYVSDYGCPCFFNILAEGRNRPEQFLKSLRKQLQRRYQLTDVEQDDLRELLQKVASNIPKEERFVIVVDALDEVTQELGENLLHLPKELPVGVYFLLTRRPYALKNKQLTLSPGLPMDELNLEAKENESYCRQDIKKYLQQWWEEEESLQQWAWQRHLDKETFVTKLAEKSENNFMYLRYVICNLLVATCNQENGWCL